MLSSIRRNLTPVMRKLFEDKYRITATDLQQNPEQHFYEFRNVVLYRHSADKEYYTWDKSNGKWGSYIRILEFNRTFPHLKYKKLNEIYHDHPTLWERRYKYVDNTDVSNTNKIFVWSDIFGRFREGNDPFTTVQRTDDPHPSLLR